MSFISNALGVLSSALSLASSPPKIIITAYKEANFSGPCGFIYLPLVSLEALDQNYKINWNGGKNGGAQGQAAPLVFFQGYDTESSPLEIETVVDATGVHRVPEVMGLINYDKPNVEPYVKMLKKVIYDFNSETHRPNYLTLTWGKIFSAAAPSGAAISGIYKCVLEEMKVKYELFSSDGTPVRARISLKFLPFTPPEEAAAKHSPDLTHIIEVQPGDNLPKLCKEIYESTEYYHQVAQINNLPSAFALKPGMKLLFPPLDKFHR